MPPPHRLLSKDDPSAPECATRTLLQIGFKEHDLPDVVYIEQLTSAIYLEQRAEVELYLAAMDQLSGETLTPAATVGFIEQIAEDV